jgi:hypothetical protein
MRRVLKGKWEKGNRIGKWVEIYPNGYYKESKLKYNIESNIEYFNSQNIKISKEEFDAKVIYQICITGNCYNGFGVCEYDHMKHFYIGNWVNGKKDGFVADFETATKYYYGIWKADTLIKKIDEKEAEKYLTANSKIFLNLFNSNKIFAAASSLIENCTTKTCTSGDCKNGFGTEVDCQGNTYTGNFTNSLFHGKGKLIFANGNVYDGYWVNNLMSGKGKYTWGYDNYYEGDWVKGIMEGKGIYKFSDGEVYEGSFINNERHGKGKSVDKEGRVRDGNWVNNAFVITEEQTELNRHTNTLISALYESIEKAR